MTRGTKDIEELQSIERQNARNYTSNCKYRLRNKLYSCQSEDDRVLASEFAIVAIVKCRTKINNPVFEITEKEFSSG